MKHVRTWIVIVCLALALVPLSRLLFWRGF